MKSNIDVYDEWTLQELENLSKMYGLSISFQKISEGLNYQIADNGTNLSGGEKQKITFLRAMIKDADIIILNEAFSNCDEGSRRIIHNIVFAKDFFKTVILVSHYREDIDGIDQIDECTIYLETEEKFKVSRVQLTNVKKQIAKYWRDFA